MKKLNRLPEAELTVMRGRVRRGWQARPRPQAWAIAARVEKGGRGICPPFRPCWPG